MNGELSPTTFNLLVASKLPGVGKASLRRIAADTSFYKTPLEQLADLDPVLRGCRTGSPKLEAAKSWAKDQIEKSSAFGVRIVGFWDASYPPIMRLSDGAPALFWYKGDDKALQSSAVTVIGTREPTAAGVISARRITTMLATNEIRIVSGLALGIDTHAHEACIDAGGRTVAVLAGGLDSISPKRNAPLAELIVERGGGLLSEFPIGSPSVPTNFVTRDVTQAALAAAVILVQTDRNGGSLHASRAIVRMRRPLFVVAPIPVDEERKEPKIQGNLALLTGAAESAQMDFPKDYMTYVQPLRSRDDYPLLLKTIEREWLAAKPAPRATNGMTPSR